MTTDNSFSQDYIHPGGGAVVHPVVSALELRSGGWWLEPGLCRRVVFLDKKLYSTLPLFTQVPVTIMLGGSLAMDYHPIQEGLAIFLFASCHRNRS